MRKAKHGLLVIILIILTLISTVGCKVEEEKEVSTSGSASAKSAGKDITEFVFPSLDGALSSTVTATIDGTKITATVPFGTDLTALVPAFTTNGLSVEVDFIVQINGETANDFSNPVIYRVVGPDGSIQDYTVTVIVAPNSASKDITAFSFTDANAALTSTVIATISGTEITATVPFGTDVTALVPIFTTNGSSVEVGGTAQISGTTANDFSSVVTYRVTADNSTAQDYTVTVTPAQNNNEKDITAFSFTDANAALSSTVAATISGTTITATVPFGTDLTALVGTFTTTGSSVKVGATVQTSGTTPNNFSSAVTYTVTAGDSTTQDYTVTVTVAPDNTTKDITAFSFTDANAALTSTVVATISGTTITATVPYGTDLTALVATFTTTGSSVEVNSTVQTSGITANDFSSAVTYRVTADNSSTQDYTVTVTVAPDNTTKDITIFSFTDANAALTSTVVATISGTTITAMMPYGTDVTALVATFGTTGSSVAVGGTAQNSGTTTNDFSSPVTYTVTAGDSSTQDYTVTVTPAQNNNEKDITAFSFTDANAALSSTVVATISGTTITATVPYGTDLTALVATFTTTGSSVEVDSTVQTSGTTDNDFSSAVTYRVTAGDTTTQDYTATVTVAENNTTKDITAFSFTDANAALTSTVAATISGTAITATVPFGTDLTALVATFTITGSSVAVGGTAQISGTTANDFSSPVVFTVTAGDSSTQNYTVTVTEALNEAKDIIAFSFTDANAALSTTVVAAISGTTITAMVPYGTDVTALAATFTTTGAYVEVSSTVQNSGTTTNNFTGPVTYTVTAGDSTTQDYSVTVSVIQNNNSKDITAFSFTDANAALSSTVAGTISGTTISATVPFGTDVTALAATFTTTGASVKVGSTMQVSGTTANNFGGPVVYTVTAGDNTTQYYLVAVTVSENNSDNDITAFSFTDANAALSSTVAATIVGTTITAAMPFGTDLTALAATFTTTGLSVAVGATAQISGTTANDFSSPVTYTVTAVDSSTQDYTVTLAIANSLPSPTGPGGVYAADGSSNLSLWLDAGKITGLGDGADMVTWDDQSGNGNDAVAGAATASYSATGGGNGQSAVTFDQTNSEYMIVPLNSEVMPTNEVSVFVIGNYENTSQDWSSILSASSNDMWNDGWGFGQDAGTGDMLYFVDDYLSNVCTRPIDFGTDTIWSLIFNTTENMAYGYRSEDAGCSFAFNGPMKYFSSGLFLGAGAGNNGPSYYMTGDIEEIIEYDVAINDAQRIIISNYLAAKYAVPLTNNNIYDEDDAVNGDYDFEVAGIGQAADASNHTDAQGTGLVRINTASDLNSSEFLMWGHDNSALSSNSSDVPVGTDNRVDRIWRVSENGGDGVGTVKLTFDCSAFTITEPYDLQLLIDADGTFTTGATTHTTGIFYDYATNIVTFTGVDFSDNDYFTLGSSSADNVLAGP
ncbi:MAG: hypothetical protein HOD85_12875 [Deltaproteobacteria bacterium]|nr:hypothetical protein [Deltaproteobacteria bacterium]